MPGLSHPPSPTYSAKAYYGRARRTGIYGRRPESPPINAPFFTLPFAAFPVRVTPLLLVGMAAALVLALNATLMLVAPTRYDVLPRWLRPPNTMIETQLNKPKGTGETRITGLLVLAMLTWVVYDMLTRPH